MARSSRLPTSRSSATGKRKIRPPRFGRRVLRRDWSAPRHKRQFAGTLARPFALFAVLAGLWPTLDPALVEPPAFLSATPERIAARFTRCGRGRGQACVVDGDTFKLGQRKIRIVGIDAPETHPAHCPEEARLGEAATAELIRLLNQGPFEMTARIDDMRDRYGRDLRVITRNKPDGTIQSIAEDMRASGLAHRYLGRKSNWC